MHTHPTPPHRTVEEVQHIEINGGFGSRCHSCEHAFEETVSQSAGAVRGVLGVGGSLTRTNPPKKAPCEIMKAENFLKNIKRGRGARTAIGCTANARRGKTQAGSTPALSARITGGVPSGDGSGL